jgi:hypothetical protein
MGGERCPDDRPRTRALSRATGRIDFIQLILIRSRRSTRARAAAALLGVGLLAGSRRASADSLGQIEQSHRPPPSSTPAQPSSGRSHSHSSSGGSTSGDDEGGGFPWLCLLPGPWSGYCFYGATWLRVDRGGRDPETLALRWPPAPLPVDVGAPGERDAPSAAMEIEPADPAEMPPAGERKEPSATDESDAPRYAELQGSGYAAANHAIEGFDLRARAWLWVGGLDAAWLHLTEPESPTLKSLNLFHASAVGTLVAAPYAEAHVLMGLDLLYGHDVTPAFGPGLEIRTYPARRFTVDLSSRLSIFADGYPFLDTRLEMGLALGRIDVLAGGRWFFQAYEQQKATSLLGPSLSVLVRIGP